VEEPAMASQSSLSYVSGEQVAGLQGPKIAVVDVRFIFLFGSFPICFSSSLLFLIDSVSGEQNRMGAYGNCGAVSCLMRMSQVHESVFELSAVVKILVVSSVSLFEVIDRFGDNLSVENGRIH